MKFESTGGVLAATAPLRDALLFSVAAFLRQSRRVLHILIYFQIFTLILITEVPPTAQPAGHLLLLTHSVT